MHIVIVARGLPSSANPMNGIFEWDQARALQSIGVEVTLIVLDLRSIRRKRDLRTHIFEKDGINIVYGSIPLGRLPAQIVYYAGKYKLCKLLKIATKKFGAPDLVHAHFTDLGAIAADVSQNLKIPCVITEHSSTINLDSISDKAKYYGERAYKRASIVIAVSSCLKKRILQHFGVQSEIVSNVVDTNSIKFNGTSKRNGSKILFVATGSLLYNKGFDILIKSFAELPSDKAELLIIGEGPDRNRLTYQIKELGLENRVKLLGLKTRDEISEIYAQADCFVLPSRRETFGVVYIEAMLAGLPVIATRCGGPEDFVDDTNGILVDVENSEQLTMALLEMIQRSRNFSSQAIHNATITQFGPQKIAAQLLSIYKSTVENNENK